MKVTRDVQNTCTTEKNARGKSGQRWGIQVAKVVHKQHKLISPSKVIGAETDRSGI